MAYGLTLTGFVPKTFEIIRAEINAALYAAFGKSIDLSDKSALGQIVAIVAERFAQLWEVAEQVNASQDPDAATGTGLDALSALTGTLRAAAAPSLVTLTLTGTPGSPVAVGSTASTLSTHVKFEVTGLADPVIAALPAWIPVHTYAVGDRVTNSSRAYQCITAGLSAGSGGPVTTSDDETDLFAHWIYLGEGTGAVDSSARSVDTGPIVGNAGDIRTIETPVLGWAGVRNLLDADPGTTITTDEALRVLREAELAAAGGTTAAAIRSDILQLVGVTACTVFVNDTDTTDADGVLPHSFETLVRGGDDTAVAEAILANLPAGIRTVGTTTVSLTDSEGNPIDIKFSRPAPILIYVDITLTKFVGSGTAGSFPGYPSDGDAEVKSAIVAWGDSLPTGKDSVASGVGAQAFKVPGVIDVSSTKIGTAPSPTLSTPIAVSLRELAVYDTSRITVHSSDATP